MFISLAPTPSLQPFETRRRAWLEAREDARRAYRAWASAGGDERRTAYTVYCAAEEREEAAARAFGVA
jgi:hypothetical protein